MLPAPLTPGVVFPGAVITGGLGCAWMLVVASYGLHVLRMEGRPRGMEVVDLWVKCAVLEALAGLLAGMGAAGLLR